MVRIDSPQNPPETTVKSPQNHRVSTVRKRRKLLHDNEVVRMDADFHRERSIYGRKSRIWIPAFAGSILNFAWWKFDAEPPWGSALLG